jgi:hypothetical protein
LRTGNRVVAAQINSAGFFSIGTADNRPLLYDFPNTDYRSHFNVWLDGRLFSSEPSRTNLPGLALLQPPAILADSALVCRYGFDGLLLEQRLRHEQYSDSTGAIFVQYLISNPTAAAHEAGLLLELDTKVNDNDKTPFLTNFGYSAAEMTFTGDSIPDFLQAFEALPPQPGLVAKFTLAGAAATLPDFIAVGDWINLSKAQWDYVKSDVPYNDSAVLLRWNPVRLGPGESVAFGTYYGVGEVSSRTDTLTLSVIAPERLLVQSDTLSPNPFSVSAFVTNTGFAAAHNVRGRLLLPEALQLVAGENALKEISPRDLASRASGAVTWKVQAQCLSGDSLFHMKIEVLSDDAPGNAVTRPLFVPACFGSGFTLALQPKSQSLVAGEPAQVRVQIQGRGNFNEEVALELWPTLPGFAAAISPSRLRPGASAQIDFTTRNTLLPGDYRFVVYGRSAAISASDTLTLQIKAAQVDVTPPFTRAHNPAAEARNVLPETAIAVEVLDEGAGVDTSALVMLVNEAQITPKLFWFDQNRVRLDYQPAQPFHYNDVVRVTLRAKDAANPVNEMAEERYSFHIVEDFAPPFVTDHQPAREAQRVAANTAISFHVRDELAGVDSNALVLTVNGAVVKPVFSGAPRDLSVRHQPASPFLKGQTVSVSIAAQDLSSPPNVMAREQYSFRVAEPVYDLIAESLQPRGELRAGALAAIIGEVRNALDAIAQPVVVRLLADGAVVKDTVLTSQQEGQRTPIAGQVRFAAAGVHEIVLLVDEDDRIAELSENNNRQSLFVEIAPALVRELVVRPNPFTPNDDGYNDAVEFNFSTLGLSRPALRIFDVDGLAVVHEDNLHAGVFVWRGRDRNGRALPPGIYLYSLQDSGRNVANGYVVLAR